MKKYLLKQVKGTLDGKKVNFDVDGTLIRLNKTVVRPKTVKLLNDMKRAGAKVKVWSRNGKDYAENVGKRIGLKGVTYASKNVSHTKPDISVDDEEHSLGKKNIDATKI